MGIILQHEVVGEYSALKPFALAIPLILIGIYVIIPVFRRCYYISIRTNSDVRKLPLKGCSPSEVVNACRSLGYTISESSPNKLVQN